MEDIWLHEKNFYYTYSNDYFRDRIINSKFLVSDISNIIKRELITITKIYAYLQIFEKNPVKTILEFIIFLFLYT